MIHHKLDLQDTDQNIVRPVILSVGQHIRDLMGLPKDLEISYIGQGEARHQFGSTVGNTEPTVRTSSSHMLTIDAVSKFDEANFSETAGHRSEHQPFFADATSGVVAKPIYQGSVVTIQFEYETPSRNEAIRWRNDVSYKVGQLRNVLMHDVTYHFVLPQALWVALKHIYDLRETVAGYDQAWPDYIREHLSSQAVRVSNIAGAAQRVAIRETQTQILGFFDFTSEPEQVESNADKGNWIVRFSYEFRYSCPTAVSLTMPVIVHQQPVSEQFLPVVDNQYLQHAKRASLTKTGLMLYESNHEADRVKPMLQATYIPDYDRWMPDTLYEGYGVLASMLVGITPGSKKLLNLRELGNYNIDANVLDWVAASEHPYLHVPNASPLMVAVFRNECLSTYTSVKVSPELDVTLEVEPDMRKRYRVVLLLSKDILKASPNGMRRLAAFPDAMRKIIRSVRATKGQLNQFMPHVDLRQFEDAAINGGHSFQEVVDHIVSMNVMMTAQINAERIQA